MNTSEPKYTPPPYHVGGDGGLNIVSANGNLIARANVADPSIHIFTAIANAQFIVNACNTYALLENASNENVQHIAAYLRANGDMETAIRLIRDYLNKWVESDLENKQMREHNATLTKQLEELRAEFDR